MSGLRRITRWAATLGIAALFVLNLALPYTSIGHRGNEALARADAQGAFGELGAPVPDLDLVDYAGEPVQLADFRGKRVLLTFERSVDW